MENMGISSEGHAKNANYIKGLWKKFSSMDCRKRYKFHKSSAEFFFYQRATGKMPLLSNCPQNDTNFVNGSVEKKANFVNKVQKRYNLTLQHCSCYMNWFGIFLT